MKKVILLVLVVFNLNVASAAEMTPDEEYLMCALSSAAAYAGESGDLAKRFFAERGWKLNEFDNHSDKINVKMHYMSRADSEGKVTKILFITGTEDLKDVGIDVKIKPVPLHDDDPKILVHRGFRDYADAILKEGILEFFVDYIKSHPDEKIYITGHSLGGAISMMVAVKLADAGADMENIKVVTFGAPAIGNKNFAEKYKDKIDLTRIVMDSDIVDISLNIFGYTHFGEVVNYKQVESSTHYSHAMALYLDCALRNFYDAGLKVNFHDKIDGEVYIAPIHIVQKSFRPIEEKYIKDIMIDGYTSRFKTVTFAEPNFAEIKKAADFSYNVREYLDGAKKSGSKFIIVPLVHTKPVKEAKQRTLRILVEEFVFNSRGGLLTMNTSGMTTTDLTILDAAFLGLELLREEREKTLQRNS